MRSKIVGFASLFIAILVSGCNAFSEPKDGLSYEEYIKGAQQYVDKGDGERAIPYYKKALKIKPEDAKTHTALGRLYDTESQKSYREAHSKYTLDILTNQNKKRDKDPTKELEGYGFKSQYKALALKEYKEAIKLDPDQWNARYFVATDHYNNKRYDEAIKEYIEVLKYNPKCSIAYGMLAQCYLEIGNHVSAKNLFDKQYELDHDQENYFCSLGKAYYIGKDYDKGFEMLMRLKNMKSPYYDQLSNFKSAHNIP